MVTRRCKLVTLQARDSAAICVVAARVATTCVATACVAATRMVVIRVVVACVVAARVVACSWWHCCRAVMASQVDGYTFEIFVFFIFLLGSFNGLFYARERKRKRE